MADDEGIKVTFRIPAEDLAVLDAYAERCDMSRSQVIRRALRRAVAEGRDVL